MKVLIDLNEIDGISLSPISVYRSLYTEYWEKLRKQYGCNLWGLAAACDTVARELYSQKTKRRLNVKNLILTYSDAEACFRLFKQFADVWAANYKPE